MGPRGGFRLVIFGAARALAVGVVLLVFALLPATVEGFTLIELVPCGTQADPDKKCLSPSAVLAVVELFGVPCNRAAAQAWNDYIGDGDFSVGFNEPPGDQSGIFVSLTPAPRSQYLYTYGNGATGIRATMVIRLEDLKKLPQWRGLASDTQQASVAELNGRWDVVRASGPIGGFPGNLHFDINKSGVIVCVVPEYRN